MGSVNEAKRTPTRAVLFDLGGTLVSYYRSHEFPEVLDDCLRCTLESVGLSVARLDFSRLRTHALRLDVERADLRVRRLDERLRELLAPLSALDDAGADRACRAFLAPIFQKARLHPEACDVLRALGTEGVKTAIVSNTPWGSPAELWRAELERHGLLPLVNTVVFCVDVGFRKPHPAPFHEALRRLDTLATQAVFVGDDPRWDVAGAERAGLRPILVAKRRPESSTSGVIEDLRALRPLLDP